jgi:hypothetical protein
VYLVCLGNPTNYETPRARSPGDQNFMPDQNLQTIALFDSLGATAFLSGQRKFRHRLL